MMRLRICSAKETQATEEMEAKAEGRGNAEAEAKEDVDASKQTRWQASGVDCR